MLLILQRSALLPLPPQALKDSSGAQNKQQQRTTTNSERIPREPQVKPPSAAVNNNPNPFAVDEVTWELPSSNNANPFETAQKQQNPFGSFDWGAEGGSTNAAEQQKLPTLSDFLSKDECKVTDEYLNLRGFGRPPAPANPAPSQSSRKSNIEFEPTSKMLPLVVAAKPKDPSPPPPPKAREIEEPEEPFQWFTRDRGGAFEEDDGGNSASVTGYDDDYAPAVIDYGHGANSKGAEDDDFDLPRGERSSTNTNNADYYDYSSNFDDVPSNSVTIDYGHGSAPPRLPVEFTAVPNTSARPGKLYILSTSCDTRTHTHVSFYFAIPDFYFERKREQEQERYYDKFFEPSTRGSRGRGRGGSTFRGRGRGRGFGLEFGREFGSSVSSDQDFNIEIERVSSDYNHGAAAQENPFPKDSMMPAMNRGRGRGQPLKFGPPPPPADDFAGYDPFQQGPEDDPEAFPDVAIIDSTPIESKRRNSPINKRRDRERDRSDSFMRNRRSNSKERVLRDPEFDEDRRRYDRNRDQDRRSRRDEPRDRERNRERRASRDRYGRVRRSRSRSPLTERAAAFRGAS